MPFFFYLTHIIAHARKVSDWLCDPEREKKKTPACNCHVAYTGHFQEKGVFWPISINEKKHKRKKQDFFFSFVKLYLVRTDHSAMFSIVCSCGRYLLWSILYMISGVPHWQWRLKTITTDDELLPTEMLLPVFYFYFFFILFYFEGERRLLLLLWRTL